MNDNLQKVAMLAAHADAKAKAKRRNARALVGWWLLFPACLVACLGLVAYFVALAFGWLA